jgi:predicted nucleic acid-binding protein
MECGVPNVLPSLFEQILIPPTVFQELQHPNTPVVVRAWMVSQVSWLKVQAPVSVDSTLNVDRGEQEAISLAIEIGASAILIDDLKGRIEATRRGLRVAGTIGILEAAAQRGLIDFVSVINRLRQTGARLDSDLIQAALFRHDTSSH